MEYFKTRFIAASWSGAAALISGIQRTQNGLCGSMIQPAGLRKMHQRYGSSMMICGTGCRSCANKNTESAEREKNMTYLRCNAAVLGVVPTLQERIAII
jgi:hypothetical protein